MQCEKCGSQDGEYKGPAVSKKTGKPWRGWKCAMCGTMKFLPVPEDMANQFTPKQTPQLNPQLTAIFKEIQRTNQLLAKIVGAQNVKNGNVEPEPEELVPDEEFI